MLPLKDDLPTLHPPVVTMALIAVNVAVYLYQLTLSGEQDIIFIHHWGLVPGWITGLGRLAPPPQWGSRLVTLFTHQFVHGGILHVAGNMLYLWIFGNNVEDALGKVRFLLFYLLGGVLAATLHLIFDMTGMVPMVGASGAIAAVLGAYFMLYPRARVVVLVWFIFIVQLVRIPAVIVLGVWFFLQVINLTGPDTSTAWLAHIGGFIAGMFLVKRFLPRGRRPVAPPWRRREEPPRRQDWRH
ncbi:MAG: rhomboid family intramembrane serine protease [Deltaproteobacteria bacterium]|nr:rhomboid family intramembrane serine protease [Deltaproteobacteria bacterium]